MNLSNCALPSIPKCCSTNCDKWTKEYKKVYFGHFRFNDALHSKLSNVVKMDVEKAQRRKNKIRVTLTTGIIIDVIMGTIEDAKTAKKLITETIVFSYD